MLSRLKAANLRPFKSDSAREHEDSKHSESLTFGFKLLIALLCIVAIVVWIIAWIAGSL